MPASVHTFRKSAPLKFSASFTTACTRNHASVTIHGTVAAACHLLTKLVSAACVITTPTCMYMLKIAW